MANVNRYRMSKNLVFLSKKHVMSNCLTLEIISMLWEPNTLRSSSHFITIQNIKSIKDASRSREYVCYESATNVFPEDEDWFHDWILCRYGERGIIRWIQCIKVCMVQCDIMNSFTGLCVSNCFSFFCFVRFNYRYGLRGRELINNVGKVMIQGGGTFGTFMAIGTGIRC